MKDYHDWPLFPLLPTPKPPQTHRDVEILPPCVEMMPKYVADGLNFVKFLIFRATNELASRLPACAHLPKQNINIPEIVETLSNDSIDYTTCNFEPHSDLLKIFWAIIWSRVYVHAHVYTQKNPTKSLWSFVKSLRVDSIGIPPLREGITLITYAVQSASLFGKKFRSAFTHEDTCHVPHLAQELHPPLRPYTWKSQEFRNCSTDWNPTKRVDRTRSLIVYWRYWHRCLPHSPTAFYNKSLEEGTVPAKWHLTPPCVAESDQRQYPLKMLGIDFHVAHIKQIVNGSCF